MEYLRAEVPISRRFGQAGKQGALSLKCALMTLPA